MANNSRVYPHGGAAWTADEDALLLELAETAPVFQIARQLGRTQEAVSMRLNRLRHDKPRAG